MRRISTALYACLLVTAASAEPWLSPGDLRLRNDLQRLVDAGVINIPLTTWPISWADIDAAIARADVAGANPHTLSVLQQVRRSANDALEVGFLSFEGGLSGSAEPRVVRTFEDTPREEGEAYLGSTWMGERFALSLRGTYVDDPADGEEFRPDHTYIGVALGNWMLSAGWQERWWGPGRDGSTILSSNARPTPGIAIQRNISTPADSKWFRWMGPWTLTSFMNLLDDERVIENGLLWGFRFTFRPVRGLELSVSRTAQWCGDNRACDFRTFLRVVNGNDNQDANVDRADEPGNQLAGFDARWSLPRNIPAAVYLQWTAEDTRRTGAQLHQWLRQLGVEHWGSIGDWSHRTHVEYTDTTAHLGSLGEGSAVANSSYNNSIFETGYRYRGRVMGHGIDGDGTTLSLGSVFTSPDNNAWSFSIRRLDINRTGIPDARHSLSAEPLEIIDVHLSHDRLLRFGRLYLGVGYRWMDDFASGTDSAEFSGFVRWSTR